MSHRIALRALSVAFGSVVLAGCIADAPSPADTDVQALGTSKAECSEAPPDGRMLYGTFCSHMVPDSPFPPGLCIQLAFGDKTVQGFYNSPGRARLGPGTYWLTVTDNSPNHNFSLSGPKGLDEDLTTIPEGSPSSPCSA